MGNASASEMTTNNGGLNSPAERSEGGDWPMPVAREIPPPESPRRSRAPFLLTPQMPVSPLPRQIQEHKQPQSEPPAVTSDASSEKGIPTLLTWTLGGNSVLIQGSWDNWSSRKPLHKSGKDHSVLLVLPSGIFHYKYIVDGELRFSPDLPFVKDEAGQVSNILDVHDFIPESLDSVSGFEAPSSPDSTYSRLFPTEEDFTKDAPLLPSQLLDSVLKTEEQPSLAKPQHVVLNHLFLEKGLSQRSLLSLSLSQRFRGKYVTLVLYKPIKR